MEFNVRAIAKHLQDSWVQFSSTVCGQVGAERDFSLQYEASLVEVNRKVNKKYVLTYITRYQLFEDSLFFFEQQQQTLLTICLTNWPHMKKVNKKDVLTYITKYHLFEEVLATNILF